MTQAVLLGDIAEINMGQSPKSEFYNTEGEGLPFMQGVRTFGRMYPVIDTWCVKPTKIANEGDLLFSVRAPVGDLNFAPARMCIGRGLASMKSRNNKFLYYLLEANKDRLISSQTGSVFGSVNATILKNFKVTVPESIEEQDEMTNILWTIDKKIELNRKMNETLEQMGQALFRHYFIDNPEAEKWEDDYINTQVDIKYGKNLPTKNLKDEGYPVFGGNGQIGYYEKYIYERPMVLVACRGAASGDINISKPKSFVTNNSLALEIRSDSNFTFEYLRFYSYCRKNGYHEFVSGSAQPQITVESLSKCRIPIPSRESIGSFTEQARHLVERMLANEEQIQTLTTLRDTLLPRLISGKVKV